jgi:transposase InsO family protein
MVAFIDAHRGAYGVEPICAGLPIAPSVYDEHQARRRDPARQPPRVRRDAGLCGHIVRVWREHREVYGVRKVWKQLLREGLVVARCTVARLMRRLGLAGAVRGRAWRRTTIPETAATGSGDPPVHGDPPQPALGGRPDLCGDLARVRVRGLRHRRVLAANRGLAGVELAAKRSGS